jgi:hypothetical protein
MTGICCCIASRSQRLSDEFGSVLMKARHDDINERRGDRTARGSDLCVDSFSTHRILILTGRQIEIPRIAKSGVRASLAALTAGSRLAIGKTGRSGPNTRQRLLERLPGCGCDGHCSQCAAAPFRTTAIFSIPDCRHKVPTSQASACERRSSVDGCARDLAHKLPARRDQRTGRLP